MSKEPSIQDFIKQLGAEIHKTEQTKEQLAQLVRLKEIAKVYDGEDKLISSYQVAERLKTQPEEFKILSGFSRLDSILKGFRLRQVVTVAAPTKSGKTSFCVDLTTKMRAQAPLWFPFEEGADELVQKFLDRDEEPPLFYVPARITGNTLLWIEKKIIESIAKYGTQVVFIDHLHFIVPFSAERQDLRIGETMRALKTMAKKWNIVIFLIAHLKKTKLDTAPDLEDLRDSSFIAQESDTVIILWREATRGRGEVVITDNVTVSVQANRRTGKTGNVKMVYKDGHFYEQALEQTPPPGVPCGPMLHNVENQLFFQEFKLTYLEVMRAGYRAYERTQDPRILERLEELQRLYQEIEPLYDANRTTRAPEPDRLLSKEDQGVGHQERLL